MKKILSTVLVCVLLLGCVFTLASCGTPNSDPAAAKEALDDAGYNADITDNPIELAFYGAIGIKSIVSGYKVAEDDEDKILDAVSIYYFEEDADMDKAYETLEKIFNEAKSDEENKDLDFEIGKSGNMIWFGTADGIKAAN